ncbi:MAG: M56 family metallopeptidase [Steroidobacteraceae bacterium]
MLASVVLYGLLVGLLLSAAAWSTERAVAAEGWSRRWVWGGAMLLSLLLPAAMLWNAEYTPEERRITQVSDIEPNGASLPGMQLLTSSADDVDANAVAAIPAEVGESVDSSSAAQPAVSRPSFGRTIDLNAVLPWLWGAGSLLVLSFYTYSWMTLHRLSHSWAVTQLLGVPVCVTARSGPAVMGFFKPIIIVPEWLLCERHDVQCMVLSHEQEHLRARDPLLLLLGLVILVLVPWNLPLWWQLHQLRFAMEVDCDSRVLRQGMDAAVYGETLLEVGIRGGRKQGPLLTVALIEPMSQLEQRLRIMLSGIHRYHRWLLAIGTTLSVSLVLAATQIQAPVFPEPPVVLTDSDMARWNILTRGVLAPSMATETGASMAATRPTLSLEQQTLPVLRKLPPNYSAAQGSQLLEKAKFAVAERYPELYQQPFTGMAQVLVLFALDGSIERMEKIMLPPTNGYTGSSGQSPTELMRQAGMSQEEMGQFGSFIGSTMPAAMLSPARLKMQAILSNREATAEERQAAAQSMGLGAMGVGAMDIGAVDSSGNNLQIFSGQRRGPNDASASLAAAKSAPVRDALLRATVKSRYPELFNGKSADVTTRVAALVKSDGTVVRMVKYAAPADPDNDSLQGRSITLTMSEGVAALRLNATEIGTTSLLSVPTQFTRADGQPFNVPATVVVQREGDQPESQLMATGIGDYAINKAIAARYFPEQLKQGAQDQRLWVLLDNEGAVLDTGLTHLPFLAIMQFATAKNPGFLSTSSAVAQVRADNGQVLNMYFIWSRSAAGWQGRQAAGANSLPDILLGLTTSVGMSTVSAGSCSALKIKFNQGSSCSIANLMKIEAVAVPVSQDEFELRLNLHPVGSQLEAVANDPWPMDGPILRLKYGSTHDIELSNGTQPKLHLAFVAERMSG